MAADAVGDNFEPVGIADTFPPDLSTYHAVVTMNDAPGGTRVKAAWSALDTGGTLTPGKSLGNYEITVEGSRNIDFTYQPPDRMPPGNFKVDIYVNGQLARTLTFRVDVTAKVDTPASATQTAIAAAATPQSKCPPFTPTFGPDLGFDLNVTMAKSTEGANFDPVNPTNVFGRRDTIHAVVNISNAPDGTDFRAVWIAEDVGDAAPCGYKLNEGTLTTGGSRNLDYHISPVSGWPSGLYRVDIYVNGSLALTQQFFVQ